LTAPVIGVKLIRKELVWKNYFVGAAVTNGFEGWRNCPFAARSAQVKHGRRSVRMLTQERVRELFDYREDGELIWRVSLRGGVKTGDVAGCLRKDGYKCTRIDGKRYLNHRLIFLYHRSYFPENQVDHVDRNSSNNRIENLREVGQTCNSRNSKVREDSTSKVTGVGWHVRAGRWCASIKVPKRQLHLGSFRDFIEAVAHRLAAEQCLNWEGCHNSTSAYLHMQKYLEERRQNES